MDSNQIGIWEWDPNSLDLVCNDAMFALYGVRREDFSGAYEAWSTCLHRDDRAATEAALQAAVAGTGSYQPSFRVVWPDGQVRHIKGHAHVVRNADGVAIRVIGTNWDDGDYANAQRKLKFIDSAVSHCHTAFFWLDEEARIIDANDFACRDAGYTREELVGQEITLLNRNFDHQAWRERISEANRMLPRSFQARHRRKDGTEIPVEITSQYIGSDEGGYMFAFAQDITERLLAETRQAELESRLVGVHLLLESVVEHMPFAVFLKSAADLKLVLVNAYAERLFGLSREELLGKTNYDFWPTDQGDALTAADRQVLASNQVLEIPEEMVSAAGQETRFVRTWKVGLRSDSGEATHLLGISTDITDRVLSTRRQAELEAQLHQSQKMEAIGTLAGGIAHDFNNALATILGNAELARQDAAGNAGVQESLVEIQRAGSRARELVRQILAFSRRQPTDRVGLDLGPLLAETMRRLLRATAPARLDLQFHAAPDLPPVLGNAAQIEQVLINLVTNAIQALAGGAGSIEVTLDTVEPAADLLHRDADLRRLHEQHPGRAARLRITDTGPGMQAKVLERIFEPFFTTKPVGEGTGLGLSVVHGIVRAHEGVIRAVSEPGTGTTFTIYLPVTQQSAEAAPEVAIASPGDGKASGGQHHVLCIDDDASVLSLIERLLQRQGCRVSAYNDPRDALAALRADPTVFDLVLTDHNMPGLSGLQLAQAVHGLRADLPVVLASGYVDQTLKDAALAAGVQTVLFKADDLGAYCAAVQQLLGGRSAALH